MPARRVIGPSTVAAVSLSSTTDPATDRPLKQAEQAIADLQAQVRALTKRIEILEAGP